MKEKINYFFTHRFLLILSVFIILVFTLFTSCFANNTNNSISFYNHILDINVKMELPSICSKYKYYMILPMSVNYDYRGDGYFLLCSDYPLRHKGFDSNTYAYKGPGVIIKYYVNDRSKYTKIITSSMLVSASIDNMSDDGVYHGVSGGPEKGILYANHNIYDISGENLVFQGAPVTVEQITIPAIHQAEEIPQAMGEVLKILLPIGLIVLSIGFAIYLTRLVISRMK